MWFWSFDGCFFNMYASRNYAGSCGYANFTAYMDAYFTMVHAPRGLYPGFTRMYWAVPTTYLSTKASNLRQGLRRAHDEGLVVELLADGSDWVMSDAGVATGVATCQQVVWFNGNATDARDVFDGVHYDIEPHTLGAGWFQNATGGKDRYNNYWEANLISIFRGCRSLLNRINATVAWDVPDDYYYYNTDLWNALVANPYVDYLSVMSYHSTLAQLTGGVSGIGGVTNVLASLRNTTLRAMFGVEVQGPRIVSPLSISFWPVGVTTMESTLAQVNATYQTNPWYMGNIIHPAETYWPLPLGGAGDGSISFCANMGRVLWAYSNLTTTISMRVYRPGASGANDTLLSTNDVSGYYPGPWSMPLSVDGPYRIELYDAANGAKASSSSAVGMATCVSLL